MTNEGSQFEALLDFLDRLGEAHLGYHISYKNNRAILVTVRLPLQHWEFEFHEDPEMGIDVEVLKSSGVEEATERMKELFERWSS
jgi:hypothetical protein